MEIIPGWCSGIAGWGTVKGTGILACEEKPWVGEGSFQIFERSACKKGGIVAPKGKTGSADRLGR